MPEETYICPHCQEQLIFRLGSYECPGCDYVLEMEIKKAAPTHSKTDSSRLEKMLRGEPPTRELGDPGPLRR